MGSLVHGTTRIRNHCIFSWVELEGPELIREFQIESHHCADCISELRLLFLSAIFVHDDRSISHPNGRVA